MEILDLRLSLQNQDPQPTFRLSLNSQAFCYSGMNMTDPSPCALTAYTV